MEILDDPFAEILAASTDWDADGMIVKKICELGRNGSSVTVMAEINGSERACRIMKDANVRVLGFSCLHANAIVSESNALVTSAGLTRRGQGFGVGLRLGGKRAGDIKKEMQEWQESYQYEFK